MKQQVATPALYQQEQLFKSLKHVFGDFDTTLLKNMLPLLDWIELTGGETLMREGDVGDDLYFVISGRLRASVRAENGEQRVVGEIIRGETIGEMTLFTGEPRSATVVAIRDSVMARMTREVFQQLLLQYPMLSINLTRLIIERLKRSSNPRLLMRRPVNICLLPISNRVATADFGEKLVAHLQKFGKAVLVSRALVEHELGKPEQADAQHDYHRVSHWLEELEASHDFLIFYAADPDDAEWNKRCVGYSDEILLLANADEPVAIHPHEKRYLSHDPGLAGANQVLILLHEDQKRLPANTHLWLERRPVSGHIHIRPELPRDMARLARIECGRAIGLVLCGGGARGFAHLGVYKAMHEYGITVDYVGGTSIGAVMGAFVSFDLHPDVVIEKAREAFEKNPTNDYNFLPTISLIRGGKLKRILEDAIVNTIGFNAYIEDSWKNFYCIATNFSQAREDVLRKGSLAKTVRASLSIPGALPPVLIEGDLLTDGGTFNNFPTDVMARMGMGKIIGVDLMQWQDRKISLDDMPSAIDLIKDKFRRRKNKKYQLPSLPNMLLGVTLLYSVSRQMESRKLTDLCFNPDLRGVSMLDWKKFDHAVAIGYRHACEVLAKMTAEELAPYRDAP